MDDHADFVTRIGHWAGLGALVWAFAIGVRALEGLRNPVDDPVFHVGQAAAATFCLAVFARFGAWPGPASASVVLLVGSMASTTLALLSLVAFKSPFGPFSNAWDLFLSGAVAMVFGALFWIGHIPAGMQRRTMQVVAAATGGFAVVVALLFWAALAMSV